MYAPAVPRLRLCFWSRVCLPALLCTRMKGREQCLQRQYTQSTCHPNAAAQAATPAIVTWYRTAYHFVFTFHIRLHNASSRPDKVAIWRKRRISLHSHKGADILNWNLYVVCQDDSVLRNVVFLLLRCFYFYSIIGLVQHMLPRQIIISKREHNAFLPRTPCIGRATCGWCEAIMEFTISSFQTQSQKIRRPSDGMVAIFLVFTLR